eukprot:CFRG2379T1
MGRSHTSDDEVEIISDWENYYAELLSTSDSLQVNEYQRLGNRVFAIDPGTHLTSIGFLEGINAYTSIEAFADVCGRACKEVDTCCGFAFSYSVNHSERNECIILEWHDLPKFTVWSGEGKGAMQVFVEDPSNFCPYGQYVAYLTFNEENEDTGLETLTCRTVIDMGKSCGLYIDLTNHNGGCTSGSSCKYDVDQDEKICQSIQ